MMLHASIVWKYCGTYEEVIAKECVITLEGRPHYCDRGSFIAKVFPSGELYIDIHDGWPRYYFDADRAKLEIEAWLKKRGQI
jgi:hypothetical protein